MPTQNKDVIVLRFTAVSKALLFSATLTASIGGCGMLGPNSDGPTWSLNHAAPTSDRDASYANWSGAGGPQPIRVDDPEPVINERYARPVSRPQTSSRLPPRTVRDTTAASSIIVASGDTLFNLARRNNTSVAALMQANGLASPEIKLGQTLLMPRT